MLDGYRREHLPDRSVGLLEELVLLEVCHCLLVAPFAALGVIGVWNVVLTVVRLALWLERRHLLMRCDRGNNCSLLLGGARRCQGSQQPLARRGQVEVAQASAGICCKVTAVGQALLGRLDEANW